MTNSKWLRRALLGGVALGVATTGAQAEDLSALKAQLEALQNRVNELETTPAAPSALPDGASLITLKRGQGSLSDWNVDRKSEGRLPQDTGFTIAVTPTADVPAPVTEVTVSGYVKGDAIYDFDQDSLGDTFTAGSGIDNSRQNTSGVRFHARQSRFRIRSRTDTAVGQLRTLIEGDFFRNNRGNPVFRLRHAWGEWDMTPNWTLGVGRFWRIHCDVFTSISTLDFGGTAGGCSNTRAAQVRFTHTNGPLSWRFGVGEPHMSPDRAGPGGRLSPDFPALSSAVLYDAPGGHQLFVGGTVEHIDYESAENDINDDDVGWEVQGGANINLGDIATFTGHLVYSDGITNLLGDGHGSHVVTDNYQIDNYKAWGGYAGLSFNVTDTTQFNVQYGHANPSGGTPSFRHTNTIHANIQWRPVRQMRLGWEVVYGWKENTTETANSAGRKRTEDAVRGQFAAWFFF